MLQQESLPQNCSLNNCLFIVCLFVTIEWKIRVTRVSKCSTYPPSIRFRLISGTSGGSERRCGARLYIYIYVVCREIRKKSQCIRMCARISHSSLQTFLSGGITHHYARNKTANTHTPTYTHTHTQARAQSRFSSEVSYRSPLKTRAPQTRERERIHNSRVHPPTFHPHNVCCVSVCVWCSVCVSVCVCVLYNFNLHKQLARCMHVCTTLECVCVCVRLCRV